MISQEENVETKRALSIADRRAFMKLPLEERRRRFAEQAEKMVEHYESEQERAERG